MIIVTVRYRYSIRIVYKICGNSRPDNQMRLEFVFIVYSAAYIIKPLTVGALC